MLNRNKRGIALNLKTEGGRRVLRRMIAGADALTENYRLGTMEKLGFGDQTLKEDNPGLIYCSISGYGRTGPCADKGGFDLIAQGLAGLMSMTGDPGQAPIKAGSPIADINAGIARRPGVRHAAAERRPGDRSVRERLQAYPRAGISRPLLTAGRATNASSARVTCGKPAMPTRSAAS